MRRINLFITAAGAAFLVSACGGGSDAPCGASYETFSIFFTPSTQTITSGTPVTVVSTVKPENCRGDMTFSSASTLPPGMSLSNGNITGTPTKTGTFSIYVQIDSVNNYGSFTTKPYGRISLTVQ
jgi:hypothetical protein